VVEAIGVRDLLGRGLADDLALLHEDLAKVNTIAFSTTPHDCDSGATPAIRDESPSRFGVPPNTASTCGAAPGSISVSTTSNGANIPSRHATVSAHTSAGGAQPGIVVG